MPDRHLIEVELVVPCAGRDAVELMLPVWTPGSYKVRDYARHLDPLRAVAPDGTTRSVEKVAKSRWRVVTDGADRVTVCYRLWARELTVRTNFVGRDFALINGAATFVTLADGSRPHEVMIERPAGWSHTCTSLSPIEPDGYRAEDYDELVDSPFVLGRPGVRVFEVETTTHELVTIGEDDLWDGERAAADARRVVETVVDFWGRVPYDRYLFLTIIDEGYGGLEHGASSVLLFDRWRARRREGWVAWLGLVAHELFHAWNGKRLRPVELGPFDYLRETHTRGLWVVEGVTSYYDDLLVRRAGLSTPEEYLKLLSKTIRQVLRTPGRAVRSLGEGSFDAWIKLYQPDENTANSSVSYYRKGALVAWVLDARIRRATDNARCLDDVMRAAYDRFAGERGFSSRELAGVIDEIAGEPVGDEVEPWVEGTAELPLDEPLTAFGLRFAPAEGDEPGTPWLGASTQVVGSRLLLRDVRHGTPAAEAGLDEGDELIAVDGYRVPPRGLEARLAGYRPGQRVELLIARRSRLRSVDLTVGTKPGDDEWALELDPVALPAAVARRDGWLGRRSTGPEGRDS